MKHSIRVKITFVMTALIIFTVFLCWFINRTFLESYYLHSKMEVLAETLDKVEKVYKDEKGNTLSDAGIKKLDQIQSNSNVQIYVFNVFSNKLIPSYPAMENFRRNEYFLVLNTLMDHAFPGTNPTIINKKVLSDTKQYTIYKLYDTTMNSNYVDLVNKSNDSKIIFLRTTFESIHEGVVVANQFLAYIGIIATIIGTFIMLLISKKITAPILKLADIAKLMSDLDFEVKYPVNTKDEIGELGNSINALSDKLETTITELKQANNE
ncbi:MAG TPA: HAMP domain-containing protein, partial [Mobilitalea sp.]|nr:HAMP domain-containing protein [Mobilitalea sp.]